MASQAKVLYKLAYKAHYQDRDLEVALKGYRELFERYPESLEAAYARTQIENLDRDRVQFE